MESMVCGNSGRTMLVSHRLATKVSTGTAFVQGGERTIWIGMVAPEVGKRSGHATCHFYLENYLTGKIC